MGKSMKYYKRKFSEHAWKGMLSFCPPFPPPFGEEGIVIPSSSLFLPPFGEEGIDIPSLPFPSKKKAGVEMCVRHDLRELCSTPANDLATAKVVGSKARLLLCAVGIPRSWLGAVISQPAFPLSLFFPSWVGAGFLLIP